MQAMLGALMQQWWQRFRQKFGRGPKGEPVWGPEPPTIQGICSHCGAVVLKG
jgi:hypothetical protein